MIQYPLASPLFLPTVIRVASLLLFAAMLIALVERHRLRRWSSLRQSTLFQRVLSWALMAPTFVLGVFSGAVLSLLLVLYLALQGTREFASVTGLGRAYRVVLLLLAPATVITAALAPEVFAYLPLIAFLVVSIVAVLRGEVDVAYRQVTLTIFGFMYLPHMLSSFVLIGRHLSNGTAVLLIVGLTVALSDVFAFVAGQMIGGPRLSPRISPNKTLAGTAGNVAGAYAACALMMFAVPQSWPAVLVWLLPALIASGCVCGDLLESLIKRTFLVKDAGTMLPGFGGLLDRIDSLIVALPLTYLALRLAG